MLISASPDAFADAVASLIAVINAPSPPSTTPISVEPAVCANGAFSADAAAWAEA
jgi:hypothetical protein